ncbi:N-acyl-L-amino acid amidohydrolase, partial [Streptomyces nanshensis]
MHPELGNQEFRTTTAIKTRLERAGLRPRVLAMGTGLICDIHSEPGPGADQQTADRQAAESATAAVPQAAGPAHA